MIIIPFLTFPSIEKLIIPKQSGESLNIKLRDNTIKGRRWGVFGIRIYFRIQLLFSLNVYDFTSKIVPLQPSGVELSECQLNAVCLNVIINPLELIVN